MREAVNLCKQSVKKSSGKEYAYWVLRWRDANGKHHGKNVGRVGQLSKRQAEKLRQAKQLELSQQPGRRNVSRAPTLTEYLEQYFDSRQSELAPGTLDLHRQTGRYLLGHFGESRRLDSVQRADARAFKAALANGKLEFVQKRKHSLVDSTVNMHIRNARKMFGMAFDDDLISFNPFDKIAGSAPRPKSMA